MCRHCRSEPRGTYRWSSGVVCWGPLALPAWMLVAVRSGDGGGVYSSAPLLLLLSSLLLLLPALQKLSSPSDSLSPPAKHTPIACSVVYTLQTGTSCLFFEDLIKVKILEKKM